jgi:predicted SpoU family rRNA methylase
MKITIKENFELFPEQSLHDLVNKWEAFKKETEKWEKECQTIKESCEKIHIRLYWIWAAMSLEHQIKKFQKMPVMKFNSYGQLRTSVSFLLSIIPSTSASIPS